MLTVLMVKIYCPTRLQKKKKVLQESASPSPVKKIEASPS